MSQNFIRLKNGTTIRSTAPSTVSMCQGCAHFVSSVISTGKGLCGLYSEIVAQEDSCRHGFQAKAPRGQENWLSKPVDLLDECQEDQ